MRKIKVLILIIISILSFTACSTLTNSKEYSYTIVEKNGITDEQVGRIKAKIDKIYKYFDDRGYELDEIKFIMANNTRVDKSRTQIIIDFENISDFELMQLILQNEFSDYLNYGLMYGVIHDIAKSYNLEFEEINNYSIEEIEEHWDYMFLSYINFTPEVASESELEIAKYLAKELVNYILDTYGNEYLFDLMKKSSELVHANKVNEILDEWIRNNGSDSMDIRRVNKEIFKQNPEDKTLAFSTGNIYWILYLSNKELYLRSSIHENTKTFYDHMDILYEEISRLEEEMEFDKNKLPDLIVEIYNGVYKKSKGWAAGTYKNHPPRICIDTITAFSHEFVHFTDYALNKRFKYAADLEMRAEYYSRNFELDNFLYYWYRSEINESKRNRQILAEVEDYLGRTLKKDDYYLLFNDLLINAFIESGMKIPSFFDVTNEKEGGYPSRYPSNYWISLFNFIKMTYGKEALDTIMFEDKLPDGTMKNMADTIEEWEIYIRNLNRNNYGNYYD